MIIKPQIPQMVASLIPSTEFANVIESAQKVPDKKLIARPVNW
jgi:hypothetical protein